jgi:cytochrome c peroxidase
MVYRRFLHAAVLFATGVLLAAFLPAAEEYEQLLLTPIEHLGKELFFDPISDPPGMSCASCHAPEVGWSGPDARLNLGGAVYPGAVGDRFGNRRPPTSAYATFSPSLHYDREEETFVGGNF